MKLQLPHFPFPGKVHSCIMALGLYSTSWEQTAHCCGVLFADPRNTQDQGLPRSGSALANALLKFAQNQPWTFSKLYPVDEGQGHKDLFPIAPPMWYQPSMQRDTFVCWLETWPACIRQSFLNGTCCRRGCRTVSVLRNPTLENKTEGLKRKCREHANGLLSHSRKNFNVIICDSCIQIGVLGSDKDEDGAMPRRLAFSAL